MRFIRPDVVLAIHEMLLIEHGGPSGIRDERLLESALTRPQNKKHYGPGTSVYELAAAYCYGIVKNHPFVDGNKRTGATVMGVFLMKNGKALVTSEKDLVLQILGVADGSISEEELAVWIKKHSKKYSPEE